MTELHGISVVSGFDRLILWIRKQGQGGAYYHQLLLFEQALGSKSSYSESRAHFL